MVKLFILNDILDMHGFGTNCSDSACGLLLFIYQLTVTVSSFTIPFLQYINQI